MLAAAEDRVAVRKAPEAPDDVAVAHRIAVDVVRLGIGTERLGELAGLSWSASDLAVLERQVGEEALHR